MTNINVERKGKYFGFRVSYSDYMAVLSHIQQHEMSISDFFHSLFLPIIDRNIHAKSEQGGKALLSQELPPEPTFSLGTKSDQANDKNLWSSENESLLQSFLIKP